MYASPIMHAKMMASNLIYIGKSLISWPNSARQTDRHTLLIIGTFMLHHQRHQQVSMLEQARQQTSCSNILLPPAQTKSAHPSMNCQM